MAGVESDIRYVEGVREPIEELARVLRSADWATGRDDDVIRRALESTAVVVTAWRGDRCVGILRVISDGIYRALIEDVVIDPDARGQGIGRGLVEFALSHPDVAGVEELILFTMVPVFWSRFGFEPAGLAMKRFQRQSS